MRRVEKQILTAGESFFHALPISLCVPVSVSFAVSIVQKTDSLPPTPSTFKFICVSERVPLSISRRLDDNGPAQAMLAPPPILNAGGRKTLGQDKEVAEASRTPTENKVC